MRKATRFDLMRFLTEGTKHGVFHVRWPDGREAWLNDDEYMALTVSELADTRVSLNLMPTDTIS